MSCVELPIVSFDFCSPMLNLSEIANVYVADEDAADFTDWTDTEEWNSRLSNDGNVPDGSTAEVIDLIRKLTVIADMPLPTPTEISISGARIAEIRTNRILNIDVDETTAANYTFMRATETVTGLRVKLWFKTLGNVKWGGNSGISGTLKLRPVLSRGTDELEKYIGTFKWSALQSPERYNELVDAGGSLEGESSGSSDGNEKLKITFTSAEETKVIIWTAEYTALYGSMPIFQVWSTDAPKQLISVPIEYTESPLTFTVYLPGTNGFIEIV